MCKNIRYHDKKYVCQKATEDARHEKLKFSESILGYFCNFPLSSLKRQICADLDQSNMHWQPPVLAESVAQGLSNKFHKELCTAALWLHQKAELLNTILEQTTTKRVEQNHVNASHYVPEAVKLRSLSSTFPKAQQHRNVQSILFSKLGPSNGLNKSPCLI